MNAGYCCFNGIETSRFWSALWNFDLWFQCFAEQSLAQIHQSTHRRWEGTNFIGHSTGTYSSILLLLVVIICWGRSAALGRLCERSPACEDRAAHRLLDLHCRHPAIGQLFVSVLL